MREAFSTEDGRIRWRRMPQEWRARQGPGAPASLPYLPSAIARDRAVTPGGTPVVVRLGGASGHDGVGCTPGEPVAAQRPGREVVRSLPVPEPPRQDLVAGVLVAWQRLIVAGHGRPRPARERWLLGLLERSRGELRASSIERMVLDAASRARARHGRYMAARVLQGGVRACPRSCRIRSALMFDAWALMSARNRALREEASRMIVRTYPGLDASRLDAPTVEGLDFIHAEALAALGRREALQRFFWQTAVRRVRDPVLRARLVRLCAVVAKVPAVEAARPARRGIPANGAVPGPEAGEERDHVPD